MLVETGGENLPLLRFRTRNMRPCKEVGHVPGQLPLGDVRFGADPLAFSDAQCAPLHAGGKKAAKGLSWRRMLKFLSDYGNI